MKGVGKRGSSALPITMLIIIIIITTTTMMIIDMTQTHSYKRIHKGLSKANCGQYIIIDPTIDLHWRLLFYLSHLVWFSVYILHKLTDWLTDWLTNCYSHIHYITNLSSSSSQYFFSFLSRSTQTNTNQPTNQPIPTNKQTTIWIITTWIGLQIERTNERKKTGTSNKTQTNEYRQLLQLQQLQPKLNTTKTKRRQRIIIYHARKMKPTKNSTNGKQTKITIQTHTYYRPTTKRSCPSQDSLCLRGKQARAELRQRGKVDPFGSRYLWPIQFKHVQRTWSFQFKRPMCLI